LDLILAIKVPSKVTTVADTFIPTIVGQASIEAARVWGIRAATLANM